MAKKSMEDREQCGPEKSLFIKVSAGSLDSHTYSAYPCRANTLTMR